MFDTVWAAALALHKTAANLSWEQSLLDFNYTNENLSEIIYNNALNVTFFGLTVSVHLTIIYFQRTMVILLFIGRCLL